MAVSDSETNSHSQTATKCDSHCSIHLNISLRQPKENASYNTCKSRAPVLDTTLCRWVSSSDVSKERVHLQRVSQSSQQHSVTSKTTGIRRSGRIIFYIGTRLYFSVVTGCE